MRKRLNEGSQGCLEGLCKNPASPGRADSRIEIGEGSDGIERLEAHFTGPAFSPHRHDTYAIGVTLSGVQTFRYRGEQRYCLPGQCHVLHPDELHDGRPGTETGFSYRIVYVDPSLIQQAIGTGPLPFLANPIVCSGGFAEKLLCEALDMDEAIDDARRIDIAISLAEMLKAVVPKRGSQGALPVQSLRHVRNLIAAAPAIRHSAADLERAAGLDRWTLARQFRAAFGTSPTRFRTMRQLDRARLLMRAGLAIAEAALEAGFADQSHMSRLFKRAYGLTPGRWMAALV